MATNKIMKTYGKYGFTREQVVAIGQAAYEDYMGDEENEENAEMCAINVLKTLGVTVEIKRIVTPIDFNIV